MSLRKQKTEKKRIEMLRSAAKIVKEKGYDRATMDDIAAELLMTKGSLYYYFDSKEQLVFQCHELIFNEAITVMEEISRMDLPAHAKIEKAIITHIKFLINERDMFNMIIQPEQLFIEENHLRSVLEQREKITSIIDRIIEEGLSKGEFSVSDPKMARMMILGAMNWIQTWYSTDGKYSEKEIANIYSNSLIKLLL
ncbi:TetR/AcrR family transcriptional regulator [Schinkia azotoformans]|nr:TetR/AcrR family transcriptional regulator [Schinkia azotoformans]MEC1697385.1 TetR/AcrR family transcriptional regulator [Schinkia azotoformans]MEC1714615.1 TetR/AcrR family transcriptional regulator [Schinkia azotoformans]MEC1724335.1 TetR/AcrR family transcriptional regulator [Schinkia azotoformans]MEC1742934.1 TetR/AcrR family transcriptional regulator [Schinkia azotoformans]MEC1745389.1 TetR/AcrR family transcriptional regulator [Schinkia azotoformans]